MPVYILFRFAWHMHKHTRCRKRDWRGGEGDAHSLNCSACNIYNVCVCPSIYTVVYIRVYLFLYFTLKKINRHVHLNIHIHVDISELLLCKCSQVCV